MSASATAANCDRTPSFCNTARICERTVVNATKCSRAISSALQAVCQRRKHEGLAVRQLFERRLRTQRTRPLEPQVLEQFRAIGPPDDGSAGEDTAERRVDLIERGTHADPTDGSGLQALRKDGATPFGRQHHHTGAGSCEWFDELDAVADAVAQLCVEKHTLRLETPSVIDHVICGGPATGLDSPVTLGQRQLQPLRQQCVFFDDEQPARRRTMVDLVAGRAEPAGRAFSNWCQ